MKKALIIGYGSAGKNHSNILTQLSLQTCIFSRRKLKQHEFFPSLKEAISQLNPDYVVVANETSEHLQTLKELETCKANKIFVEKPLFHKVTFNFKTKSKNIFVGYNLRFHPLLLKLKKVIAGKKVISLEINVGSFLPDWRKTQNYKKNYSTILKKGGGVLRDLSHEIDYLLWIFGPVTELVSLGGHYSSLFGDSDDVFKLIVKMESGSIVSIHLDYLNRLHKRIITVLTDKNSYIVDLVNNTFYSNSNKTVRLNNFDISKTYYDQHYDIIYNKGTGACSFNQGLETLKVLEAAEKSNHDKKWIKI